jgi:hypothetical protein
MNSLVTVVERSLTLLARASPKPLNDDTVRPGWIGFGVFLLLAAAAYFLFRSMNRHIKRIDFVEEPLDGSDGAAGAPPQPERPDH